jgi:hypothetical protein
MENNGYVLEWYENIQQVTWKCVEEESNRYVRVVTVLPQDISVHTIFDIIHKWQANKMTHVNSRFLLGIQEIGRWSLKLQWIFGTFHTM